MQFLGVIPGLGTGVAAGLLLINILGLAVGLPVTVPVGLFSFNLQIATALSGLGVGGFGLILLWMILMVLVTLVFYAISSAAVRPLPPLAGATFVPFTPGERFGFGAMIGICVGTNVVFWLSAGLPGAVIAAVLGLVGLLALIPAVSMWAPYHVFLGWISWLMPLSWPATAIGAVAAVILGVIAVIQVALGTLVGIPFRFDFTTGSLEVTFRAPIGSSAGFSLGHFNFLVIGGTTTLAAEQLPFNVPGIPSHEAGHTLNTAAFGSAFLALNGIEQNIVPNNGSAAYGELCAESNAREPGFWFIDLWS